MILIVSIGIVVSEIAMFVTLLYIFYFCFEGVTFKLLSRYFHVTFTLHIRVTFLKLYWKLYNKTKFYIKKVKSNFLLFVTGCYPCCNQYCFLVYLFFWIQFIMIPEYILQCLVIRWISGIWQRQRQQTRINHDFYFSSNFRLTGRRRRRILVLVSYQYFAWWA